MTKRCINQPQYKQPYGQVGYNPQQGGQQGNQAPINRFRGQGGPQQASLQPINNANPAQAGYVESHDPDKHSQIDGYTNGIQQWGNCSVGVPIDPDEQ